MKKAHLLAGVLGALTMLNGSTVMAENKAGAVTVTLGSAYYHFSPRRHIDDTAMPNIALAYNANEKWAIEGFFGNASSTRHGGGNIHEMLYNIDGIYRFTPRGYFQPYLLAGVGVIDLKPMINIDNQFSGNINAGVGTQFFIHNMIAFRGEVRDIYATTGGKNDVMVSLGVSVLFNNG